MMPAIPVRHGGFRGDAWAIRRVLAGWDPRAVAVAAGVSIRTAKRWRADISGVTVVEVAGYVAEFAIRRGKPPLQLTQWALR